MMHRTQQATVVCINCTMIVVCFANVAYRCEDDSLLDWQPVQSAKQRLGFGSSWCLKHDQCGIVRHYPGLAPG